MNKWIIGILYSLYSGGSYFAAYPQTLVRAVCPELSALGMPCPTAKGTNGNIAARTITELDPSANLTVYADNGAKTPAIIIAQNGEVHFPYGVNSKGFFSGDPSAYRVGSDGKWTGTKAGGPGVGCTIAPSATGAAQSCPGIAAVTIPKGLPGLTPASCAVTPSNGGASINCPAALTNKQATIAAPIGGVSCRDSDTCRKAIADKILNPGPNAPPGETFNLEAYPFLNSMAAPWATSICVGRRYVRTPYFSPDPNGIPIPVQSGGCYDCLNRRGAAASNCN